jgi:hypothetical protein
MDKWCSNRLTGLGPKADLQRFLKSKWDKRLGARHGEWLENSSRRFVCVFDTDECPLEALRRLCGRWPKLVFLLDYEVECERLKGLAKADLGRLEHWETRY